jgi:hypothetical protein
MSDFLARLITRALGQEPLVEPMIPARHAAAPESPIFEARGRDIPTQLEAHTEDEDASPASSATAGEPMGMPLLEPMPLALGTGSQPPSLERDVVASPVHERTQDFVGEAGSRPSAPRIARFEETERIAATFVTASVDEDGLLNRTAELPHREHAPQPAPEAESAAAPLRRQSLSSTTESSGLSRERPSQRPAGGRRPQRMADTSTDASHAPERQVREATPGIAPERTLLERGRAERVSASPSIPSPRSTPLPSGLHAEQPRDLRRSEPSGSPRAAEDLVSRPDANELRASTGRQPLADSASAEGGPVAADEMPAVTVTIGRIEVYAMPSSTPPQRSKPQAAAPTSLEEYVQQRTRVRR